MLKEALKALDLGPTRAESIPKITITSNNSRIEWLCITPDFMIRKLSIRDPFEVLFKGDRFVVYTCLKGMGWIRWGISESPVFIQPSQSVLIPAVPEDILIESENGLELLETSIPDLSGATAEQMVSLGIPPDKIPSLGGEDYGKTIRECMFC